LVLYKSREWPWRRVGGFNPPELPRGFATEKNGKEKLWKSMKLCMNFDLDDLGVEFVAY